jgi:hypothetical protein
MGSIDADHIVEIAQGFADAADWDGLERAAQELGARGLPGEIVDRVRSIDLGGYEDTLVEMLRAGDAKAKRGVRALYWEFDLDNGWASSLALCGSFDVLDGEWTTDERAWMEGPDCSAFAAAYEAVRHESQDAVESTFVGRTYAAFGRAYTRAGLEHLPVASGYHDSGHQLLMPRRGVDRDALVRRSEARALRLPRGSWLLCGASGAGPDELARSVRDSPLNRLMDMILGFEPRCPVRDWAEIELRFGMNERHSDFLIANPNLGWASERMRTVIEQSTSPGERVQWLGVWVSSHDGSDRRRYWAMHFPDPIDIVDHELSKPYFTGTVIDPKKIPSDRSILPMVGTMKFNAFGPFIVRRDVAQALTRARLKGLRFATAQGSD